MEGIKVIGNFDCTAVKRVLIALDEKNLRFEHLRTIDNDDDDYKTVIYLERSDDDGHRGKYLKLQDSRKITEHIARTYSERGKILIPSDEYKDKFAMALKIEAEEFDLVAGYLVWEQLAKHPDDETIDKTLVAREEAKLAEIFEKFESMLKETKYLASPKFTLADLNAIPMLYYLSQTPTRKLFNNYIHVKVWAGKITGRNSAHRELPIAYMDE